MATAMTPPVRDRGRGPTWDNLPDRKRFEKWWLKNTVCGEWGAMMDELDLRHQAAMAGFAKAVWRAALESRRP